MERVNTPPPATSANHPKNQYGSHLKSACYLVSILKEVKTLPVLKPLILVTPQTVPPETGDSTKKPAISADFL